MRPFPSISTLERLLVGIGLIGAVAWLWRCLCFFPSRGWNEIRLAPAFMWAHGLSPYPPVNGIATTWIYGPLPLFLQLPASLMPNAVGAMLAAGFLNLTVILLGIATVCAWLPVPGLDLTRPARLTAFLVCLAIWPATSLEFMQADNAAVAFGLLALLTLERSDSNCSRWLAAAGCAAAIACKQSLIGLAAAECIWVLVRQGQRASLAQMMRIGSIGVLFFALTAVFFGAEGVYYHLIALPALLPWAGSIGNRLTEFSPWLLVHLGLPLTVLTYLGRRTWRRDSPWLLPTLAWLTAWPLDLVALLKNGGSANSLHGLLFFLPFAAVLATVGGNHLVWRRTGLAIVSVGILAVRIATIDVGAWHPRTKHLREGEFLARNLPGEVYFPWHPLVTFYAGTQFYHVEDGWFMRYLAGQPVSGPVAYAGLPPKMHVVAFLRNEMDWGIARSLIPHGAHQTVFGEWILYSWTPPTTRP